MTVILIIVAVVIVLGLIVGLGFIAPRNRRGSLEPPSKRRTLVDDRVVPPEEVERAALVEAEVTADLATHVPVDDVVVEVVEDLGLNGHRQQAEGGGKTLKQRHLHGN